MRAAYFLSALALIITPAQVSALEAGAAAADITPDVERYEVPMAGYGARSGKPSTGVHDPIHAKVLYLADETTRLALVTTDLRSVTPQLKTAILERIRDLGLDNANLMLAASHNHSGPSIFPEKFWQLQFGAYDPEIIPPMADAIADAVREAVESAAHVNLGYATKDLEGFTRNRRWGYDTEAREAAGEQPVVCDRLFALRVDNADTDAPIAVLVNFATHPTILGADNMEISAEWPGVMQATVEHAFAGAVALYTNGGEGDQAPAGAQGGDNFEKVADFGKRLGAAAIDLAKSIETKPDLNIALAYATPPLREPVFSKAAEEGPYAFMQPFAMEVLPRSAALQQFRIGDLVLTSLPGEPICEVTQAAEDQIIEAGAETAVAISLANDYLGYILNGKEYAHGGYEVDSRSFYGPGLGDLLVAETGALARTLLAQSPPEQRETRERTELFNGRDYAGWHRFLPKGNPDDTWEIRHGGILFCSGTPAGYIRTDESFRDYRLTLKWRWTATPGNNGVLLHVQPPDTVWPKSLEAQLQHENAGDIWEIGGVEFNEHIDRSTRRTPKLRDSSENPPGEWNRFEAICDGDEILLYINDVLQHRATGVSVTEGMIALQSEGTPIEYRNIVLEPLEK